MKRCAQTYARNTTDPPRRWRDLGVQSWGSSWGSDAKNLSQKKTHYIAPFVNGFVIDGPSGDNILIVTTESLLIFDKYYERQATIQLQDIFTGFTSENLNLCCV